MRRVLDIGKVDVARGIDAQCSLVISVTDKTQGKQANKEMGFNKCQEKVNAGEPSLGEGAGV
jgi:hypothetical protein